MKYSIIVPVYNVEKYIANCIEKLLAQDYTDFEIILVNDGSTDGSRENCERYVQKYPDRISLYNTENGGPGAARNCGIEHAAGDYIVFVDSDDELVKGALAEIDEKIEKISGEASGNTPDILIFDFEEVDETGKILGRHGLKALDIKELLLDSPCCWNKAYKKTLFEGGANRFPEKVWYEDLRFVLKIFSAAKSIAYLNKSLYIYYKRLGSIMNNSNIERNAQIIDAIEDVREYYAGSEYGKEIEFVAIERAYVDASGRILSAGLNRKLLNKIRSYIRTTYPEYKKNPYISRLSKKQRLIYCLLNAHMYILLRLTFLLNHLLTGKRVKDRTER